MVLVQKWPFFQLFFLGKRDKEKKFLRYSRTKKRRSGLLKKKFKKSKNCHFFKGVNPWFFDKNGHFSNFLLLGKIRQENVFYYVLARENPFLGYKNKKLKKLKTCHFSKAVNPRFWSKTGHFSNFIFLGNIGQENVFYDILERNNTFLGFKNKKFKKSKNWNFSKGVN